MADITLHATFFLLIINILLLSFSLVLFCLFNNCYLNDWLLLRDNIALNNKLVIIIVIIIILA